MNDWAEWTTYRSFWCSLFYVLLLFGFFCRLSYTLVTCTSSCLRATHNFLLSFSFPALVACCDLLQWDRTVAAHVTRGIDAYLDWLTVTKWWWKRHYFLWITKILTSVYPTLTLKFLGLPPPPHYNIMFWATRFGACFHAIIKSYWRRIPEHRLVIGLSSPYRSAAWR